MKKLLFLGLIHLFLFPHSGFTDEVGSKIEQPVEKAISIMQKTHKDEKEWRKLQVKLAAELESLQINVDQLRIIRNQNKDQLAHSQKRLSAKKQQLADILRIEQEMDPFLAQLAKRLAQLPEQDLPFLQTERRDRIAKLSKVLHDPDISVSEQYRKAMEALQIEAEFGVTIETYQETLERDQQKILVNILRLGRLGLYYVTLDESGCAFFNVADRHWQPLPDQYIYPLQTAVAIASKRRPAEFIDMPLGRMVQQ